MSDLFIIVCGGTGGHLAPGIATAQRLVDRGFDCILIVSQKSIDAQLSSQYPDLKFVAAPGSAFSFKPLKLIKFLWDFMKSLGFSFNFLRRNEPVAILAFGGFTSLGFVISARLQKVTVFLHEANRVPGRAIRFLSNMADRVYLPEGVRVSGIPASHIRHIGMPLRKEIVHIPKDQVRSEMEMSRSTKLMVVIGGSQGASALNGWVKEHARSFLNDGISVICVTGPGKNPGLFDMEGADAHGDKVEIRYYSFYKNISQLFSSADIVISRAGAGTIAELKQCLCPSILIPYPYAADNHQLANARDLERRGACVLLPQTELDTLRQEAHDLMFNDWLLNRLRHNLRQLDRGDVAEGLSHDMDRFLKGNESLTQATLEKAVEKS